MEADGGGRLGERMHAYEMYARLQRLLWHLPTHHPATPHVQRAAEEAEAHWRGLMADAPGVRQSGGDALGADS